MGGTVVINLLVETLKALADAKKLTSEVRWVQWGEFYCTWPEFEAVASFEYDNGYGGAEINVSLRVVGSNWWLERGEYDGSEWWEFKTLPTKPVIPRTPVKKDLLDD